MNERSARLRDFFARYVTAKGAARNPRVEAAFAAVPREPFAGPGPWLISVPGGPYISTPDDDPAYLYQDTLIALDVERGINIGEPSLHARLLDALSPPERGTVLHVGAGAGYYSAIIACLVGPGGRVHAYEIVPDLAARAERNLADFPRIAIHAQSGAVEGLPEADAIYVNAGVTQPGWAWLEALRTGGRLMFPLQAPNGFGGMLCVDRPPHGLAWPARFVWRAGFIACQTRQDDVAGRRLSAAFATGGWEQVKALRLDDSPDATCWFAGDGWWLSTAAPEADVALGGVDAQGASG